MDHNEWVETSLIPSWVKLDAETEHVGTLLACCESLKLGVTTVADGGSMQYPDANASAFRACGIRGVIAGLVFDRPPWGRDYSDIGMPTPTTEEALDRVEEIVATYHGGKRSRVQAFASVIGSDTCSDELIVGAKAIADRHEVMLDFHQSVQQFQVDEHRRRMGYTDDPVCYFDRLGALGENVRLLELHVVGDDGIEVLSRRGVSVVVCDPLYMSIGTPEAPSRAVEMQRAGINVCNGTDDPGFLDVLRFAQMTAAVHSQTEHEMFRYCTTNAATSMGLGDVIGSIEVGKEADLVVWSTHGLEWQPFPTPALDGMFKLRVSASGVEGVMVGGEIVVEGGELTLVDESELRQRVRRLADAA
jgi:cytosine/adenosine deaminase-related metal-dependent hydrolase